MLCLFSELIFLISNSNKLEMSADFPLYNSLAKNINNKDLTIAQKKEFVSSMETFDTSGQELIYALIRVYQKENKDDTTYGGDVVTTDGDTKRITYDLDQFPNKLKQILYKFMKMHVKKMEEDRKMEQVQI